jgi:L-ribulose-5-phosphate 3-epimerase UlaE
VASLKDTDQLAQQLEELAGQLRSELGNGDVDFEKLVSIADRLSEQADGLAETFTSVNDTLMERLEETKKSGGGSSRRASRQSESKSESKTATARS